MGFSKRTAEPKKAKRFIAELKVLEDLGKFIGHAQSMQKWSGSHLNQDLHDIGLEIIAIDKILR